MNETPKTKCTMNCTHGLMLGSVALNLFLLGLLAAPLLAPRGPADMPPPPPMGLPMPPPPEMAGPGAPGQGPFFEKLSGALSLDEAAKFKSIFAEEREGMKASHEAMRATKAKISEILKQEKPDIDALRKVLDEVRTSGGTLHAGMARTIERIATELSPESRRKIADIMEREKLFGGRGPMGGRGRGQAGPGMAPPDVPSPEMPR